MLGTTWYGNFVTAIGWSHLKSCVSITANGTGLQHQSELLLLFTSTTSCRRPIIKSLRKISWRKLMHASYIIVIMHTSDVVPPESSDFVKCREHTLASLGKCRPQGPKKTDESCFELRRQQCEKRDIIVSGRRTRKEFMKFMTVVVPEEEGIDTTSLWERSSIPKLERKLSGCVQWTSLQDQAIP